MYSKNQLFRRIRRTIFIVLATCFLYYQNNKRPEPLQKVFFLKTHKTGSSTIQNILFRYGLKHNLTFALPERHCRFDYPMPLAQRAIRYTKKSIDIFAHHARMTWEDTSIIQDLFKEKPFRLTILRDPISLLPSVFHYFNHIRPIQLVNHNISQFLSNPKYYYDLSHVNDNRGSDLGLTRNGMAFDLGYPGVYSNSPLGIQQMLEELDENFDFVMIAEYFDEGLILLKHYLNWDLDDILYVALNKATYDTPIEINEKIKIWSHVDVMIYQHFNTTFWKKVEEFGKEKMKREKQYFQAKREEIKASCFKGTTTDSRLLDKFEIWRPRQLLKVHAWLLKDNMMENKFCRDIARTEIPFTRKIFESQFPGTKSPC